MTITTVAMALDAAACFSVFTTDLQTEIRIAIVAIILVRYILFFCLWCRRPEPQIIKIGAKVLLLALSVVAVVLSGWNWILLVPLIVSSLFVGFYSLTII